MTGRGRDSAASRILDKCAGSHPRGYAILDAIHVVPLQNMLEQALGEAWVLVSSENVDAVRGFTTNRIRSDSADVFLWDILRNVWHVSTASRPSGPPMRALGDKIGSTIIAQSAGVPTIAWNGDGLKVKLR